MSSASAQPNTSLWIAGQLDAALAWARAVCPHWPVREATAAQVMQELSTPPIFDEYRPAIFAVRERMAETAARRLAQVMATAASRYRRHCIVVAASHPPDWTSDAGLRVVEDVRLPRFRDDVAQWITDLAQARGVRISADDAYVLSAWVPLSAQGYADVDSITLLLERLVAAQGDVRAVLSMVAGTPSAAQVVDLIFMGDTATATSLAGRMAAHDVMQLLMMLERRLLLGILAGTGVQHANDLAVQFGLARSAKQAGFYLRSVPRGVRAQRLYTLVRKVRGRLLNGSTTPTAAAVYATAAVASAAAGRGGRRRRTATGRKSSQAVR